MNDHRPLRTLQALLLAALALAAPARGAEFGSGPKDGAIPTVTLPQARLSLGVNGPVGPAAGVTPLQPAVAMPGAAAALPAAVSAAGNPTAASPSAAFPAAASPAALPASAISAAARPEAAPAPSGEAVSAKDQIARMAAAGEEKAGAAFDHASRTQAEDPGPRPEDAMNIYRAANPKSNAAEVLSLMGDFGRVANRLVVADIFTSAKDGRQMDYIVPPHAPMHIRKAAAEVLDFVDRSYQGDPQAVRFVQALARLAAPEHMMSVMARGGSEGLAPNPLHGGEYWDLAAGPNGMGHMMGPRDPNTTYRFFDHSPYVVELLSEGKRLMGKAGADVSKIDIVHADVNALSRPPTPIAVLRNKNVHTYVKGFEKKLDTMTDWIAEGGVLLIENDPGPQRLDIVTKLRPMIERLISQGWTLSFGGFKHDGLETLTLTRPRADQPKTRDAASARIWQDYMDEVHASEMRPAGLEALLRAMFGRR